MLFGVGEVAFNILDCGIFLRAQWVNISEGYFLGKFTTSLGGAWFPALLWWLP